MRKINKIPFNGGAKAPKNVLTEKQSYDKTLFENNI
jgi:hypothetical protein